MPRYELPDNIAQLHLAFRGKRLTGEIKKRVDSFKTSPKFERYCKNARVFYGLSPRELCLHVAMACMLTPKCTRYQSITDLDMHMMWDKTVHGHTFWRRVYHGD